VTLSAVARSVGTVHPAPFPIACSGADKWRNNHCASSLTGVVDPDMSTERDWLQFLWAWHTSMLHNDIGEMFDTLRAACNCTRNSLGQVKCAFPGGACAGFPLFWDWSANGASVSSLREGVISKASGGKSSTEVDPANYEAYRAFVLLSDGRGVSRNTAP
jgi:hypothetical protein